MTAPPAVPGFRLRRPLSRLGGPTEVWAAEREGGGPPVALKVLRDPTEDRRLRFAAEGRLLRRLGGRHHLLACHEVIEAPPALVLELAEQGSVAARLEAGPLPLRTALAIGRQAAEALAWLHANGVTHRDVKPSNLHLMGDGTIRLGDLGVAAHGSPPRGLPEGWVEEETGTLGYAAPELLRDAGAANPSLDSYGLGATLYELLSGRLPHRCLPGESDAEYRGRLAAGVAPELLAEAVPDATAADPRFTAVARLVHGALEPDPARRVPLRTWLEGLAALG
ncbi:MAG: serine/threonine-protein kinase [Gemmatimonadales bacterium]